MISQQTLQEFKEVFEREFGSVPDEKVLVALACDLLTLFDITYRPIKKEWVDNSNGRETINQPESHETPMARGISK
jgi:hypothetical protein